MGYVLALFQFDGPRHEHSTMTPKHYYLCLESGEKGPFTLKQLRAGVQNSTLSDTALVRADGGTKRQTLGKLLRARLGSSSTATRWSSEAESDGNAEPIRRTGFCAQCLAQTTSESPRFLLSINGIGRCFYGESDRCDTCSSVVRNLWFTWVFIPIIRLGKYRYQEIEGGFLSSRFIARKMHTRQARAD